MHPGFIRMGVPIMRRIVRNLYVLGVLFGSISVFSAAPTSAQETTRAWVSGTGTDQPAPAGVSCTRAQPCQTFAFAISQTAIGGEINCRDAGGYGTVTITRSVTIDCAGTTATILAANSTGVVIDGVGVKVVLRGISINGGHSSSQGVHGVSFVQGASLTIVDSFIMNFTDENQGNGISFTPRTNAEMHVVNTVIANNRRGIYASPTGIGSANVTLDRVTVADSIADGLRVSTPSRSGAGAYIVANDSTFSGNGTGVAAVAPAGGNYSVVKLFGSTITSNSGVGVLADGALVRTDVKDTEITNNGTGVSAINGAILLSYLDNVVDRNGAGGDGSFTGSVSKR